MFRWIAGLLALSISSQGFGADLSVCSSALQLARAKNANARISAEKYQANNSRLLPEYARWLGRSFTDAFNQLGPSDLMVDVGCGVCAAGLQAARIRGVRVVGINTQDLLGAFGDAIRKREPIEYVVYAPSLSSGGKFRTPSVALIERVGKFEFTRMQALLEAMGVPLDSRSGSFNQVLLNGRGPQEQQVAKAVYSAFDATFAAIDQLIARRVFEYRVGFAEEWLPRLKGRASLVVGVFGADFYSPDRITLLENEYDALREDGRVVSTFYGREESVQSLGASVPLATYLKSAYPRVIRFYETDTDDEPWLRGNRIEGARIGVVSRDPEWSNLLVMRKDARTSSLDFGLRVQQKPSQIVMQSSGPGTRHPVQLVYVPR